MKHLKKHNEIFGLFNKSDIDYLKNIRKNGDLDEIIFIIENSELIDEFDNRIQVSDWYSSNMSHCLKHNLKYKLITKKEYNFYLNNTFTVELSEKENDEQSHWNLKNSIYWIEPKIYKVINEINSRILQMGYKILFNDFGSDDTSYELLIGNIKSE
jgi:hypothetical protein